MTDEKFVTMITEAFTSAPTIEDSYRGRCANPTCGKGKDAKGNRVRARVPSVGAFCCPDCRKSVKEAKRQSARVRPS